MEKLLRNKLITHSINQFPLNKYEVIISTFTFIDWVFFKLPMLITRISANFRSKSPAVIGRGFFFQLYEKSYILLGGSGQLLFYQIEKRPYTIHSLSNTRKKYRQILPFENWICTRFNFYNATSNAIY